MVMIRRGRHADIPAIVDLAVESVSKDPLPLRPDRERMAEAAREAMTPNNFCMVSEIDGRVVGAVGALCSPGFWFERMQCDVVMFYCREGGEGGLMLRALARWIKSRPAIKMATFSLEPCMGEKMAGFVKKLGFRINFPQYVWVRGAQ